MSLTYVSGRVSKVSGPGAFSATYSYNTNGDLTSVTDRVGRVWTCEYQGTTHLLTKVLLKISTTTTQTVVETVYDTSGRATTQKDGLTPPNIIATVNYTLANSAQRQVQDRGISTIVTFDGGLPVIVDGPGASDSQTTYAGQGLNPGVIIDPNGNITVQEWSANGYGLTKKTDALGDVTNFAYDPLNNLKQITDALQHTTVYTYTNSLLTSFSDALGNTTTYTYTTTAPAGLLFEERDPLGVITRYTYTADGKIATVVRNYKDGIFDANKPDEDVKTTYQYNSIFNSGVTDITNNQISQTTHYTYDSSSGLLIRTNRGYGVDATLRMDYGYDTAWRLQSIRDATGMVGTARTGLICYDARSRVVITVQNLVTAGVCVPPPQAIPNDPVSNRVTTTTYDSTTGLPIATTDPSGVITRTYYDALNRPYMVVRNLIGQAISVVTPPAYNPSFPDQNIRTETVYDNAGNVVKTTDNGGKVKYHCYDQLNRVVKAILNPSVSNPCVTYTLSANLDKDVITQTVYDAIGNAIAIIDPVGHVTRTYYDALNQPYVVVQNLTVQSVDNPNPPLTAYNSLNPDLNIGVQRFYDAMERVYKQLDLTTPSVSQ